MPCVLGRHDVASARSAWMNCQDVPRNIQPRYGLLLCTAVFGHSLRTEKFSIRRSMICGESVCGGSYSCPVLEYLSAGNFLFSSKHVAWVEEGVGQSVYAGISHNSLAGGGFSR